MTIWRNTLYTTDYGHLIPTSLFIVHSNSKTAHVCVRELIDCNGRVEIRDAVITKEELRKALHIKKGEKITIC